MRPSAVDLPDPLKHQPPDRKANRAGQPAPVTNADDLLAQMAGEEVDRLLAEAREEEKDPGELEANAAPAPSDAQFRSEPSPSRLAPFTGPEQSRRSRAPRSKPAPPAAPQATPNDLALDDLFKQLGGDAAPLHPATSDADLVLPPDSKDVSPGTSAPGAALEQTLTARAQELIDRAKWEAVQDGIPLTGPEAASDRASFAAAAKQASPTSPDQASAPEEPPSVATALAAEMEEDARIHAGAVAKLAIARDSVEAGKNAGSPSGLSVTGLSVVGVEEIGPAQESTPKPAANPVQTSAAAPAPQLDAAVQAVEANAPQIDAAAEEREPLLLRLLEWLNAPLANLSDGARAALGKAAIATTVNALAVLLYVLIFRR